MCVCLAAVTKASPKKDFTNFRKVKPVSLKCVFEFQISVKNVNVKLLFIWSHADFEINEIKKSPNCYVLVTLAISNKLLKIYLV